MQQIQLILELNQVSDIWTNANPALSLPAACQEFSSASFQIQQVMLNNMGDALARRVDLSSRAYAFPCEFVQQQIQLPCVNSVAPQSYVLTGFRAGQVKTLVVYLTNNDDNVSSAAVRNGSAYQPNKWYAPVSVEMVYAGDIYARYNNGVGQLFNLINSNKASAFDTVDIQIANNVVVKPPKAFLSQWLELPFAQSLCDEDAHFILIHGKPITNGIINLNNFVIPFVSNSGWTLNISYIYNCTVLFSQGSCDYVF